MDKPTWKEILLQTHVAKRAGTLKRAFMSYCRDEKNMKQEHHATLSHDSLVVKACEFLDERNRDPLIHIREEFEEVLEAVATGNTVHVAEEIGDLLFTAIRLARANGHPINVSDITWTNHHKLSLRKTVCKTDA